MRSCAIGVEFATVFNNAMMPTLVPPERLGRLSGTGWATGYVGGLVSLVVVLGFLAANPQTGKTLLGLSPLFGLDPALREGDRAVGPLTAIWFVVFVLPLFLFTPDLPRAACRSREAVGHGLATLADTLRRLPRTATVALLPARQHDLHRRAGRAVRVRRHLCGGHLRLGHDPDRHLRHPAHHHRHASAPGSAASSTIASAPKPVILGSLAMLIVARLAILSIDARHDPVRRSRSTRRSPGGELFASAPEKVFIGLGAVIGFVAGPMQAASRTLLVRLAPPRSDDAVLRAVRAVRQGDVVHRAAAGRRRDRRSR